MTAPNDKPGKILQISNDQIYALSVPHTERLITRCVATLRNEFTAIDLAELVSLVRTHVNDARVLDFHFNNNLIEFVRICITHGTSYSALCEIDEIRELMSCHEFKEEEMLYIIDDILREQ